MYALFVLSVHVCYVNDNAKTQMGFLCALIQIKWGGGGGVETYRLIGRLLSGR